MLIPGCINKVSRHIRSELCEIPIIKEKWVYVCQSKLNEIIPAITKIGAEYIRLSSNVLLINGIAARFLSTFVS